MLNDVYTAIASRIEDIEEVFSTKPTIYFDSLPQGFRAPCFFINLLQVSVKPHLYNRYELQLDFDILFYPESEKEDNVTELNDIAYLLIFELEYIRLTDGLLRGSDISHRVIDDILHLQISYHVFVRKELVKAPLMQKLIQKYRLKE